VLSAALIGFLGFQNGANAAYNSTYQLLGESSVRVQDNLDAYFSIPQLLNAKNMAAFRMGELDINDTDALQRRFLAQLKSYETIQAIAYGNEQGELAGAWCDVLDAEFSQKLVDLSFRNRIQWSILDNLPFTIGNLRTRSNNITSRCFQVTASQPGGTNRKICLEIDMECFS
jgi:hypothetical protein